MLLLDDSRDDIPFPSARLINSTSGTAISAAKPSANNVWVRLVRAALHASVDILTVHSTPPQTFVPVTDSAAGAEKLASQQRQYKDQATQRTRVNLALQCIW